MWLLVGGIVIAAFIILPMFIPALGPVFSSITGALHGIWTYITGELGKIFAWIKNFHKPSTASSSPVATSTATLTIPALAPTSTQIQDLTTQVQTATQEKP